MPNPTPPPTSAGTDEPGQPRDLPWVRMKVAASLDGRTALPNGDSRWITSPQARADGHAWRSRADAVLTGIGTVLADDPRLDVRLAPVQRQPDLVVLDSRLRTPLDAQIFGPDRQLHIYCAGGVDPVQVAALTARGARVCALPGSRGQVDLRAMLFDLAQQGIKVLHVEAGSELNGALLQAGVVDELLLYLAPCLLGEGLPLARFGPLAALSQAYTLTFDTIHHLGSDLRIVARLQPREIEPAASRIEDAPPA
ncbi:RibD family protein [Xylophilus sp. GOD-11R]|uniref:RibD family protein n=1 Tax=Xylophilus sp. GOD-11R TaxID=3089814 RepID=UPI00298CF441|nr:RibD family protein [Xylophilus sp. GOD-11R]WPB59306.1 RibD family protein [Xylophilus sp. GOD-11R]